MSILATRRDFCRYEFALTTTLNGVRLSTFRRRSQSTLLAWRAERDKRTPRGLCCVGLAWRGFHLTSGRGRKHHTAGRVTAAADRRVGLDFIEPRHPKFDPQRLPIENDAVDCICESFRDFRPVDLAIAAVDASGLEEGAATVEGDDDGAEEVVGAGSGRSWRRADEFGGVAGIDKGVAGGIRVLSLDGFTAFGSGLPISSVLSLP
jgi:hypothetical protein